MGIFSKVFKKETSKEKKTFVSEVFKTDNVSKTLMDVANKHNISLSSLDFEILAIDTYIKFDKDSDFVVPDAQTYDLIKSNELLLSNEFEIKQSYEIRVKKFQFADDFELIGKLSTNKSLTKVNYALSPSSMLNYSETLEYLIIDELKKKKLKSNLLVDFELFEGNFYEDVKTLVAKIRILGMIEEDFNIELCKGITPIYPVKMEIIEHYKKNETTDKLVKDFIYPIKKGDLIIEIIKPKNGRNGRSCKGNIIFIEPLKTTEIPNFGITDDVTKRENNEVIKYISNKNGYVYIKENVIFIKDELEVNQISLKTGNIKGASDSDVKIEVKESGVLKEAIKDGMIVETTELVVKGNVGNGAKIKAKMLEIDGQTHRGSKILAQNVEINYHKGYLKANTAIINRLEGGIVEAKMVNITQAISGKVIAKEIKIDVLGSHLTLIASDIIEVNLLKGSENRFIIDENIVENKEEYIKKLEETYKELEIKLRKYKEKYKENKIVIAQNQDAIQKLKQKITSLKANNMVVNPNYIQKIKKFNSFIKKTKSLEEEIKKIMLKLKEIKENLNKAQSNLFLAKVVSHSGFNEFNRIEFHLTEPPLKLVYDTKKSDEMKNIFTLKDYGEMEYKIVGESE